MQEKVRLTSRVRKQLEGLLSGQTPVRVAKRALTLLLLHEGTRVEETAERVGCGTATVKRIRRKYRDHGWEVAVYDAARSGRPRKLSDSEEKRLIALACSDPPEGRARWTIRLLVDKCDMDVSFGVVQQVLKHDGLKPWREKNVVCSLS